MRKERLPILFFALASLVVGIIAGLVRLGWNISLPSVVPHHGAVMVGGFLGTLITLEKVIPLQRKYLLLLPLVSALGTLAFLLDSAQVGYFLLISASVGLSSVFLVYLLRHASMIYVIMFAGALMWLVGNITLLSSNFYPASFPWWMGFALFIISSERIELMKFLPVTKNSKLLFYCLLLIFIVGCILSFHGIGGIIAGTTLALIALWLLRNDVVGFSIKKRELTRYVAIALLCGYFCLLITAVFILALNSEVFSYDVIVHTFFIGFVFSMIFAHGPIILPGVLGVTAKPYHSILYLWLFILHASLAMRIFGDIGLQSETRMYSGVLTSFAILGYFITLATLLIRRSLINGKAS